MNPGLGFLYSSEPGHEVPKPLPIPYPSPRLGFEALLPSRISEAWCKSGDGQGTAAENSRDRRILQKESKTKRKKHLGSPALPSACADLPRRAPKGPCSTSRCLPESPAEPWRGAPFLSFSCRTLQRFTKPWRDARSATAGGQEPPVPRAEPQQAGTAAPRGPVL